MPSFSSSSKAQYIHQQSYQKKIVDLGGYGTRYFITISEWLWPGLISTQFFGSIQFTTSKNLVFSTEIHIHDESVEQVEDFCETLWKNMNCQHYEKS